VGEVVHVSGQVPIDMATGALVEGDVGAQTTQVIAHIASVLRAAGADLSQVVKTTVYLTDLAGDFATMNAAYAAAFGDHAPARATVGVAALPLGSRVEIEAVAVLPPAAG
jgi:2-iminobutanoate/2-iminopropanoate deaminase